MGTLKSVTDASFEEDVLKSGKPVAVFFWADWSGPCRQMSPNVEVIAAEHGDKITVLQLNIDQNPGVTAKYGVMSLPTLHVFQGGGDVKTIDGVKPVAALERELAFFIAE